MLSFKGKKVSETFSHMKGGELLFKEMEQYKHKDQDEALIRSTGLAREGSIWVESSTVGRLDLEGA